MDQPNPPRQAAPKPPPDVVGVASSATSLNASIDPKIAPLLHSALAGLDAAGAATGYRASLAALRQTASAPALLAQAYHAAPDYEYLHRWSVATVLADLRHPDAVEPLRGIAVAPLPKATGPGAERVLAEETMIRTAAVEGIAKQATPSAKAALLSAAGSPVFSVRRAAAQAYLAQGGVRADLEKLIPADQRFLLDIRSVTASQLPAPKPPQTSPRDPSRAVLAPGTPGAPKIVPAPDASRSK